MTDSGKNWDMKVLKKLLMILFMLHTFTLCAGKKERTVVWKWTTGKLPLNQLFSGNSLPRSPLI